MLGRLGKLCRQLIQKAGEAVDIFHLCELIFEVVEVEPIARAHFFSQLLRLFDINGLLYIFNQGNDVAHAENAAGHAFGIKGLEAVNLFRNADKLNRLARGEGNREGRAASAVAVQFGEDHAGQR